MTSVVPLRPASRTWEVGWLGLLALVLLIRFPVKFALEPPYLMDFEVYRRVAERVMQGQGAQLYEPTTSDLMMFKYTPCWALIWLPLAWLPSHLGAVLWSALSVLWLILACLAAARLAQGVGLRAPPWLSVLVVVLLVRPITAVFLNGQVDLLWGLLVIGFLIAERARRPWWSALSLALAISLKLPALIIVGYLLLRGRWQTTARILGAFLALNLLSTLLLNPSQPLQLFRAWAEVLWSSGGGRAFEIGNQSLLALMGRFLSEDPHRLNIATLPLPAVVLIAMGISVALLALVVRSPKAPMEETTRLVFDTALLTLLMVLCSPTTWIATYSALILPTTVAVACAATRLHETRRRPALLIALGGIGLLSAMTHSKFWKAVGLRYFRGESYVFLVLMTLPWFALMVFAFLWRQRQGHALPA